MISTDTLFRALLALESPPSNPPGYFQDDPAGSTSSQLRRVLGTDEYSKWSDVAQFTGEPYDLPRHCLDLPVLEYLGFVDEGRLHVKIHEHAGRLFVTDGLWVPNSFRTFPFSDESQRLVNHAEEFGYDEWADFLIDPATGCGHHALAMSGHARRVCFDVNPRAILYTGINRVLNSVPDVLIGRNNILSGIPRHIVDSVSGNVLLLVNMPFSLSPIPHVLPVTSDGGVTGAKFTFAAIDAIARLARQNSARSAGRACILCYTVGNRDRDQWEVVDKAVSHFGSRRVTWRLLEDEPMWRINGKKEQPNPMPLRGGLSLKASCRIYVTEEHADSVRQGYERLEEALVTSPQAWDVLGYGIVDIEF